MKKNAKLAPLQTSLRQVAVFLHNADFLRLRVTKPPPNSPAERCCGGIGCWKKLCHFCWAWEDFAGLVEALYLFTTANYDGLLAMEGVLLYTTIQ